MRFNNQLIKITFLIAYLFCTLNYGLAQNSQIEQQKEKVKKLEADISFLDTQISQTQKQHKNSLNELILIQNKITNRKKLLSELDKQISLQNKNIAQKAKEVKSLEARLDTLNVYFKRLVYNAYKNRNDKVWFMYILASNSLEQGYRRWSYLKNYSSNISKQVAKINNTKEELINEQKKLTALRLETQKQSKTREIEISGLQKEEKTSKTLVANLSKKQRDITRQLTQKKQEAQKLNREVERMIAKAIEEERKREEALRKKETQNQNLADGAKPKEEAKSKEEVVSQEQRVKLTGSFASNKGKLPWPVKGVVIESFGEHYHPTLKNVKLPFNNGINISAKQNAQVYAVFEGIVKQIVAMPGYNQCILVEHGKFFTFYCKLDKVNVKPGDKVDNNTVLGTLATSQNTSTLHFELWEGTNKQNPQLWLIKN